MADDIRSPQGAILDELLWGRLSSFWSEIYDPSDREALNAMYESFTKVIDAENVRLQQINDAGALETCPVFTQRRWVRFDANRYAELKAWLRFLQSGSGVLNPAALSSAATCASNPTTHAKHWHIHLPFVVSSDTNLTLAARQTLALGYPIQPSLTAVWKMATELDGRILGTRLAPGPDYQILPDGRSLQFSAGASGDRYEVTVAFDFTDSSYDNLRPRVYQAESLALPNAVILPPDLGLNLPVHVLVVHNPPPGTSASLSATNTSAFSTTRTFIPFTGDAATGVAYAGANKLLLPISLTATDLVLVYALETGEFTTLHEHQRASAVVQQTLVTGPSLTVFQPAADPGASPLFGVPGLLGHGLSLFIDGHLVSPDQYAYERSTNLFLLKTGYPFPPNGQLRVDTTFTQDTRANEDATALAHLHFACAVAVAVTEEVFDTFDDGGTFDDEADVGADAAIFDSSSFSNTVILNIVISDASTLEVYVDGLLLQDGLGYTVSLPGGATHIIFASSVEGSAVLVTHRRQSLVHVMGGIDLTGGGSNTYRITEAVLQNLVGNLSAGAAAFQLAFPATTLDNLASLVEAAFVAAAGGNPLMTLFHDEFRDYLDLPINSPSETLSALQTRNIESADTTLITIPFMVDHVLKPTVRLHEGIDLRIVDGEIQSARDLAASRGPDDREPGIWWCPVVILDEKLLAKNFGALVGDVRASSPAYRDALLANFRLRFGGPTRELIHAAACAYLGSRVFTQDSVVREIASDVVGWTVTVHNEEGTNEQHLSLEADAPLPVVNDIVYPGQSIRTRPLYDRGLRNVVAWQPGVLITSEELDRVQAGDQVRVSLANPAAPGSALVWIYLTVQQAQARISGPQRQWVVNFAERTTLVPHADSVIRVFRPAPPPYVAFTGRVVAVEAVLARTLRTDAETFPLAADTPAGYVRGDRVYRGQPVQPTLAVVYDHQSRPDWHRLTAAHVREDWSHLVDLPGLTDRRIVTVSPPVTADRYSAVSLSPALPALARGTLLTVVRDDGRPALTFAVVGYDGATALVSPPLDEAAAVSGIATVSAIAAPAEPFEFAVGAGAATTVSHNQLRGDGRLAVVSTAGFPVAGRCHLVTTAGGTIELQYDGRSATELRNVRWLSFDDAVITAAGIVDPTVRAGWVVRLTARYATTSINPSFVAAARRRVLSDSSSLDNTIVVTEANADILYNLFAPTTTVVETHAVGRPEQLFDTIDDTRPAGVSVILVSKHVIADTLELHPLEQLETFHPLVVTIVEPGEGPVGAPHLVDQTRLSFVLEAVVDANPDNHVPYTYAWKIQPSLGYSPGLVVADPHNRSTRFFGITDGSEYLVTVVVTSSMGHSVTRVATVRVQYVEPFVSDEFVVILTNVDTIILVPIQTVTVV